MEVCKLIYVKTDRIDELLKERGWSRNRLAKEAGIRPAALSELCSNIRTTINRLTLYKIMKTLDITNINEVIEIREGE
ncbi:MULTISPECIES: helix-turn-helix domain-containing protein [Bacillus]|uniref:helix-turn-helix domain-containing protein n=1 Tax=Bacillus TaxID=1386 RepID=UPI0022E83BE7|nr:helix-turn-helix transcriptional regulator [Bacillus sonorensis]